LNFRGDLMLFYFLLDAL